MIKYFSLLLCLAVGILAGCASHEAPSPETMQIATREIPSPMVVNSDARFAIRAVEVNFSGCAFDAGNGPAFRFDKDVFQKIKNAHPDASFIVTPTLQLLPAVGQGKTSIKSTLGEKIFGVNYGTQLNGIGWLMDDESVTIAAFAESVAVVEFRETPVDSGYFAPVLKPDSMTFNLRARFDSVYLMSCQNICETKQGKTNAHCTLWFIEASKN